MPEGELLSNMGGMQRVAMELQAHLQRVPGLEVTSHVLRASATLLDLKTAIFVTTLLAQVPRLVRRHQPDVILFASIHAACCMPALQPWLGRHGVRTAAIAHGLDVVWTFPGYQALVSRTLARLDLVLPISASTADEVLARGARNIETVGNGVDLERFEHLARPTPAQERMVLLSIGRLVRRKGFEWFIDKVMPELPTQVSYVVAGDGPMRPALQACIARHGLHDRVTLAGRVPEDRLMALLAGADLFVMPNIAVPGDMEGFGIVALEAAAAGLPVLGSSLEGVVDTIPPGHGAHWLPPENDKAYARSLRHLLADRQALLAEGRKAFEFVHSHRSWPSVANRYVEALADLVQK